MAVFEIVEGKPGQGKSLYLAKKARDLVKRNKKYYGRTGEIRYIYSNAKFSPEFEEFSIVHGKRLIRYWSNLSDVLRLRNVDLLWDEIAVEMDTRNFKDLPAEARRFLSLYRRRGIDIYANTQDFSMVDIRCRLMTTHLYRMIKVIGSPDPSPTKPPVKTIWGFVVMREVLNISASDPHEKDLGMPSRVFCIRREDVELYDTHEEIQTGDPPPLQHIYQYCEHRDEPNPATGKTCTYSRTIHR